MKFNLVTLFSKNINSSFVNVFKQQDFDVTLNEWLQWLDWLSRSGWVGKVAAITTTEVEVVLGWGSANSIVVSVAIKGQILDALTDWLWRGHFSLAIGKLESGDSIEW